MSANISPEYDRLRYCQDGTLNFGGITIRGQRQEELRDLLVFQYVITAREKRNSDD